MARGRRLIPEHEVASWEDRLRQAVQAALARQVASMNRKLARHGLETLTAAGVDSTRGRRRPADAAAVGALVVPGLWSQQEWAQNVDEELAPEAEDVAKDAGTAAVAALGLGAATWGLVQGWQAVARYISDRAVGTGQAIGERVNAAGVAGDPVAGVGQVLSTAGDILGNAVGATAGTAATMSTNDLAQYVTGMSAPTYLSATKTWNTQQDDKVREWHEEADGQEVALNETFSVGGEDLVGPGDPSGSDENIINCRCFMTVDGMVPEGAGGDDLDMTGEGA